MEARRCLALGGLRRSGRKESATRAMVADMAAGTPAAGVVEAVPGPPYTTLIAGSSRASGGTEVGHCPPQLRTARATGCAPALALRNDDGTV